MRSKNEPWWQGPLKVLQYNIEDRYGVFTSKVSGKLLVQLAEALRANTIVLFARDPWGRTYYDGSKVGPKHAKVKEDLIRETVREARKRNIKVIVMVGHTANKYMYEKHTDWAQMTKNGEPITLEHIPFERRLHDPEWPLLCINSPFIDHVKNEIHEVLSLGVDGVFLDSFRYQPDIEKACYCKWCRKAFKELFGFDMPEEPNWSDSRWRKLWNWRYEVVIKRLKELYDEVKSRAKNVMFMYNSHPGGWAGRTNRIVELSRDFIDVVFAECSEADHQPPGFITEMVKLTKAMFGNKPVAASRNYFHMYRTVASTTAVAIRQGLRESIIAGGIPWLLVFSSSYFQEPANLDAARQVFEEYDTIGEYMRNAKPLHYAAIVVSNETRDFYGRHHPEHYVDEVRGFYYALTHAHYPVTFISGKDLEDINTMRKYSLIILANTACMSDKAIENVRKYVAEGGNIIATYAAATRDQEGIQRYEVGISDIIGGELIGVFRQNWSYMTIRNPSHPIFSDIKESTILIGDMSYEFYHERVSPALGWQLILRPTTGSVLAEVGIAGGLWGYEYTLGRSPPPYASETEIPAIIENRYENGSAIYFSGQMGRHYWRTGLPEYSRLIVNSARYLAGVPKVHVNAPETVSVEIHETTDAILIHLLNHTYNQRIMSIGVGRAKQPLPAYSTAESVHPPRTVIPIHGIKIKIHESIKKAYLPLRNDKPLDVENKNGEYVITLSALDEYEFIVVEK
ncbi:MAG: beta-galactosidase trimerization domain-containing protein [Euryarchaeota archaeon]|nr:beta-galactosidase trimerization domain-containing protein [Euryarchaeota archaeon]